MEHDTMILMCLTATAFCWWLALRVREEMHSARELIRQEKDSVDRAERVRILTNRR